MVTDAIYHDINIYKGEDFAFTFTLYGSGSTPVNLEECTITAHLREYPEGTSLIPFAWRHNNDGGQITLSLARETANLISYSYGWFEVAVTFPTGAEVEVMHGKAFIIPEVSRTMDFGIPYTVVAYPSFDDFPSVGSTTRLYLDLSTGGLYGWNGEQYFSIGLKGDTATIRVGTVTSGPVPQVTNVGTIHDGIFDFVLQKGDKGDPGPRGPQGNQGATGPRGPQGPRGETGISEIMDSILSVYPCIPYEVRLATYILDEKLYLPDDYASYDSENYGAVVTDASDHSVEFDYADPASTEGMVITVNPVCSVDLIGNKLSLSGGTMTGSVQYNEGGKLRFVTPADEQTVPQSSVTYDVIRIADKTPDDIVGIYMVQDTSDNMRLRIAMRRYYNSSWNWCYPMQYYVGPTGDISYGLGSRPAFRKELQLGDSNGDLPITVAQGGTGATDASTAITNLGGLPLTGGTMTGDLTFSESKKLFLKENYTAGTAPASDVWGAGLMLQDSAGTAVGAVRDIYRSSGTMQLHLSTILNSVENYLRLGVTSNGTKTVSVADAAAWQNAILPDSGWLELTNATAFTGKIYYRKLGPFLYVATGSIKLVNALSAGSSLQLGTMPTGYVPSKSWTLPAYVGSTTMSDRATLVRIDNSNAKILLYSQDAIDTTSGIYMEGACVI